MFRRLLDWLEDRTAIEGAIRRLLSEEVPASSGWPQVFGSVALFAFLVQAATGILLALNYNPAPGDAYDSVRHIVTQVTGGRLLRALHHWGASLLIVVVVLHLIQTFVWGAYKKPREATWMAGVALLLLTLAFVLSGYPLPWDNHAYWGALAMTKGRLSRLLLGSDGTSLGGVALTRFYFAHVQLLPPLTALLTAFHVYLVRRHGRTPTPADENQPKKRFYPHQTAKDARAICAWFVLLMAIAIFARVPLGHMADPADASYVPRPEWYLLFLFQFRKWFDEPFGLGAVILPMLAIVALILASFIDRGKITVLRRRWGAIGLAALAVAFWAGLTVRAVATTPASREMDMSLVKPWQEIPAANLASIGLFRKAKCGGCHVLGKSAAGPDLTLAPSSRQASWLEEHIGAASQPPQALTGEQVKMLASFVAQRGVKAVDAWKNAPQQAVEGALVYQANDCGSCHKLNGVGDELGPSLNGAGERHDRSWIEQHFADPPKYSPGSIMPAFQFKPEELKMLTDYLMAIPK
jgi:ubiquinol-cytochrome c reductase cytochrome b subunit